MEGDPSICVITDSYLKGLRDFDIAVAYGAFKKSCDTPGAQNKMRPDADPYNSLGYIPVGWFSGDFSGDNSVSHALEYYVADNAMSLLASALAGEEKMLPARRHSPGMRHFTVPVPLATGIIMTQRPEPFAPSSRTVHSSRPSTPRMEQIFLTRLASTRVLPGTTPITFPTT